MADGIDVRPTMLRQTAVGMRTDAGDVDTHRRDASAAAQSGATAAGTGPLTAAAYEFAAQLDKALATARDSVEECAAALDTAATAYDTTDRRTADLFAPPSLPGFDR